MFNLGLSELLILGIIALVFIGPRELPEMARVIGRMLNELKRATGDLTATVLEPKQKIQEELGLDKIRDDLRAAMNPNSPAASAKAPNPEEELPPHEGDKLPSDPGSEQ